MRRRQEDDEMEAIERALGGLEDDADSMRLGDKLPEEHRPKFAITIALGSDESAQGDKYVAPGEEPPDEEEEL